MANELNFTLTHSQNAFLQLKERNTLFCAGFNSGKSFLMGLMVALDAKHGGDIGVYAPEHKHLNLVSVPNVIHWLNEFGIPHKYNGTEKVIKTHDDSVGNILFFPLDNPESLVGYQTYRSHIDELDTLSVDKAGAVYDKILGRNRQWPRNAPESEFVTNRDGKREPRNCIRVYSTPEGFRFCYKMWGAGKRHDYAIVKGCTLENPTVTQGYIDGLKSKYTKQQLKAYLFGEFVNFSTGSVYYPYDRDRHRSKEKIRPGETLHIGCDFNIGKMAAIIFVKRAGGKELHAVEELTDMYDTPEMINLIKDKWHSKGHPIYVYPDASGSGRHTSDASISDLTELSAAGFKLRYKRAKNKIAGLNPKVRDRVTAVNKAFEDSVLFVNDVVCPVLASCLEQQAIDKHGKPDKTSDHDHPNDAFGYFVYYDRPVRKKVSKLDISFVI